MESSCIRVLHLSDTHAAATPPDANGAESAGALEQLLADLRGIESLDLVLVTGDITDDGSIDGSLAVRDRVGAFAAERRIPHVYLPGNHDDRANFPRVFGSGHLDALGHDLARSRFAGSENTAASFHRGLRIVTLDSTVAGAVYGRLSGDQLDWLQRTLQTPAPRGTVIALHHPPLRLPDSPFLSRVGLRNPEGLRDALMGSDVRAVLCGHFHLQAAGSLGQAPVWVTPGVANRIDLTAPRDALRFVRGSGASIVSLPDGAPPTFHLVQALDLRSDQVVANVRLTDELLGKLDGSEPVGDPAAGALND